MYDVVVVGKANVDYLVRGPQLPAPGESVLGAQASLPRRAAVLDLLASR